MRVSRSFINFATFFCMSLLLLGASSCKGRTINNMEPTGDTVEVVIMQDTIVELNQQINNE